VLDTRRTTTIIAIVMLISGLATPHSMSLKVPNKKLPERTFNQHASPTDPLGERFIDPVSHTFEVAQGPVSNRCFTPYFWCFLPGYAPVGAPCWCPTPNGPVGGSCSDGTEFQ
jgi:hypothetical protein